jgi:hypothetical protein
MGIKLTNNANATLAAGINSSATSITLTSGQGARFPTLTASDYFYATLIDTSNNLEIVKCTARATDVLTVVRAQESTTARAYSTGDRIEIRITAATFTEAASVIPSGTIMLFVQTAAPTGWTKSTAHDNKALRVVSGSVSTGGSVAFTTAFASQAVSGSVGTSGATTLTTGQIPNHYHAVQTKGFASTLGIGVQTSGGDGSWYGYADAPEGTHDNSSPGGSTSATFANNDNGGGGSHTHSGGTFTGTAINLAVQYVDVIIATRD